LNDNGSDRLTAIEAALVAVQVALGEVGGAVQRQGETLGGAIQRQGEMLGEVGRGLQRQGETTARGFETLTEMTRALDARFSVLDARMSEIVTELRTHSHKGAA
jgi:hypothetical protein